MVNRIVEEINRSVVRLAREKKEYETGGFDIMKKFQKKLLKEQHKKEGSGQSLKKDMTTYLKGQFGADADDFDIEAAIYWYANDYHEGQASDLYSILSTSKFHPGAAHHGVKDEGDVAEDMYKALEKKYKKEGQEKASNIQKGLLDVDAVIAAAKRHSNTKNVTVFKKIPELLTTLTIELKNDFNLSVIISQDPDDTDPDIMEIGVLDQKRHLIPLSKPNQFISVSGAGKVGFKEFNTFLDWARNDLPGQVKRYKTY
jgi:hypothetical protein